VRRIFRKRPANSTDTIVTDRRRPAVYSASTAVSFTTSICYDDKQGPRPDTAVCRSSPWWTRLHTWTAVRRVVALWRSVKHQILCTERSNSQCCVHRSVVEEILIGMLLYIIDYIVQFVTIYGFYAEPQQIKTKTTQTDTSTTELLSKILGDNVPGNNSPRNNPYLKYPRM